MVVGVFLFGREEETQFACFFVGEGEIDRFAFDAEFAGGGGDGSFEEEESVGLASGVGTDGELGVVAAYGLTVFEVETGGVARGVVEVEEYPSAGLVDEGGEDSAVHGVDPSLVVRLWFPEANDFVVFLEELHVQSYGIVGVASEAVVAGVSYPGIFYFFHSCVQIICKDSKIF